MTKALLIAAALAGLATGGCIVHARGGRAHVHGPAVVVPAAHVHSHSCGHYYHRGGWHHHAGHMHAAGCGHHWRGGMWVVVD